MSLSPGVVLPKDMDARQYATWCKQQQITAADNTVATVTIQDGAVTFAKIQDITADRFLGRLSTDGVVQELTAAEVVTELQSETWAFSGDMGFFGVAAVGQQTTPLTLNLTSIAGTGNDTDLNTNFAAIEAAVNALKTAVDNLGLTG